VGVVLDTSVLVAAERGDFVMPAFLETLGEEAVAIAAVSAAELMFGVERTRSVPQRIRRSAFVDALLAVVPVIPFGLLEARRQGQLWAELDRARTTLGPHDLAVAATALAHDHAVATMHAAEFERVPGLRTIAAVVR
jgi:predicted nucleic acid-binding protein